MWAKRFLFILLLILTSTGCSGGAAKEMGGEGVPEGLQTLQIPTVMITVTPELTASHTPTSSPTAVNTQTATPTPVPPFEICTPLPLHPLEVIAEIVGDPYDPPPAGREERHHGVDLAYYHWEDRDTMAGEPVQAVLSGVVVARMEDRMPYGNMVMIETQRSELPPDLVEPLAIPDGESLYLLYAHFFEPPLVQLGDTVEACQPLGEVGMTGWTEIPHLHLETRTGPAGTMFESILYYDTQATQEEMDNYVLWRTSGVYQHFDPMSLLLAFVEE
jgi:murein DD-endopeptidase MepM/ murein hydrolase activator NlpD